MSMLFSMQISTYPITFTADILQIGCKRYSHQEWKNFDDETIQGMNGNALTFWKKYKEFIFTAIGLAITSGLAADGIASNTETEIAQ